MKLIEEIQQAEEKAEKLKKNAENKGQRMIEEERENAKKALTQIEKDKEVLMEKTLAKVRSVVVKRTEEMERAHKKELEKLTKNAEKHIKKAVTKAQDMIIAWPSSH